MITDNGSCYRGQGLRPTSSLDADIAHTFTRPFRPQTNGKVERYNRTLLNEWAYARPYRSEAARTRALDTWLHLYNHHRHHTAVGGPPISRVNNLVGQATVWPSPKAGPTAPASSKKSWWWIRSTTWPPWSRTSSRTPTRCSTEECFGRGSRVSVPRKMARLAACLTRVGCHAPGGR